jgi:hypothetical protein
VFARHIRIAVIVATVVAGSSMGAYGIAMAHDNDDNPDTDTLIYAPVYAPNDVQSNVCGNTTNENSQLNPAFGNSCTNEDADASSDDDED